MQPVDEHFRSLRVRVQHATKSPSIVAVGAAIRGDGATFVACGLARAFAEAGHKTLLIDANPRFSRVAGELGTPVRGTPGQPERLAPNFSVASLFDKRERLLEDKELTDVLAHLRTHYAITIVDSPAIPHSGFALQLARIADGLLVAVRLGRRPVAEDIEMNLLMRSGAILGDKAISGIVPTRAKQRSQPREVQEPSRLPRIETGPRVVAPMSATGN